MDVKCSVCGYKFKHGDVYYIINNEDLCEACMNDKYCVEHGLDDVWGERK